MRISLVLLVTLMIFGCSGGGSSQNLPPVINAIADVTISANLTSEPIAFGFSDRGAANAQVTVTSSNETLIPNEGIVVTGSGGMRSLTLTPVSDTLGTAAITIVVTDAGGLSAQRTFTANVAPQQVSFRSEFRNIFTAPEAAAPVDLNSRQFNNDAEGDDFADLLN